MMSRIKSKGSAKLKLLLILPLAAFLVLVLAEPKVVAQAGAHDDSAVSAASTGFPAAPQDKSDKQKNEEKIKAEKAEQAKKTGEIEKEHKVLQAKIKEVEVAINETDDPKKQEKLKATLVELYQKDQKIQTYLKGENGNGESLGTKYVKVNLNGEDGNGDNLGTKYVEVTPDMIDEKIKVVSMELKKTDNPKEKQRLETELKKLYVMKKAVENGEEKYVKVSTEKVKKEKKKDTDKK